MRSRIIEFILKRKRLSEDLDDEFAFGIDKCLSDGIYTAAYPLHDVSLVHFQVQLILLSSYFSAIKKRIDSLLLIYRNKIEKLFAKQLMEQD